MIFASTFARTSTQPVTASPPGSGRSGRRSVPPVVLSSSVAVSFTKPSESAEKKRPSSSHSSTTIPAESSFSGIGARKTFLSSHTGLSVLFFVGVVSFFENLPACSTRRTGLLPLSRPWPHTRSRAYGSEMPFTNTPSSTFLRPPARRMTSSSSTSAGFSRGEKSYRSTDSLRFGGGGGRTNVGSVVAGGGGLGRGSSQNDSRVTGSYQYGRSVSSSSAILSSRRCASARAIELASAGSSLRARGYACGSSPGYSHCVPSARVRGPPVRYVHSICRSRKPVGTGSRGRFGRGSSLNTSRACGRSSMSRVSTTCPRKSSAPIVSYSHSSMSASPVSPAGSAASSPSGAIGTSSSVKWYQRGSHVSCRTLVLLTRLPL